MLKRGECAQVRTEMVEFIVQVNLNLVISRRSCAVKAKECTKKRDARAELLFCSLNPLFFNVPVAVKWLSVCVQHLYCKVVVYVR